MKKRMLAMLLVLMMLIGLLPTGAIAAEVTASAETVDTTDPVEMEETTVAEEAEETTASSETEEGSAAGTLQFSTDLNTEPVCMTSSTAWNAPSCTMSVAVGTYTPAGGEAVALPEGTTVNYAWYSSADNVVDETDTKLSNTKASYSVSSKNATPSITYYYVVVTATIDGVEYTGTSQVACVKIGAANISVTLTVNNKGVIAADKDGNAVSGKSVTVVDLDYDGRHSYDEALTAAHSSLMTADDYITVVGDYGLSVTKLWGVETTNTLFYLNGASLTTNVGEATVAKGDILYASINQDDKYYSDKFTTFDLATKAATTDVEFELTLTDEDGNALSGMAIGTWEDGAFVAMEGKTTDENGKVKLAFDEAGTYVITATGTIRDTVTDYSNWPETSEVEFDCPIMAPGCTVTVKDAGELRFSGSFSDNIFNCKVGETNTFSSLYSAGYYINGTRDYSIKITTTWYRINQTGNGVAEQVENISAAFTSEDVGTWQYYMYCECEAYGVKYSARSNMANVVISEPTPIEGSSANGFVTEIDPVQSKIEFEVDKTEYSIVHYDVVSSLLMNVTPVFGKGLWAGYRIDGIKSSDTWSGRDAEPDVRSGYKQFQIPETFKAGETNVVTILVGTKYDSNGDGSVTYADDFDQYDAYNFTVSTLPGFSALTAKDSAGTSLLPNVSSYSNYNATELSGNTNDATIVLSASFKEGVKLYIGNDETAYETSVTDVEITLADYKDEDGVANIPLKLVAEGEDGTKAEHITTLHISPVVEEVKPTFDPPVIKTQPTAESSVEKDGAVTLTVEAEVPEKGTLSYQWYGGSNQYQVKNTADSYAIEGATSTSYVASGQSMAGDYYYVCEVTLTIDGLSTSIVSELATVTTNLTWVSAPEISIQPGLAANTSGTGLYKTEYTAGAKFDPLWIGVMSDEKRVDGKYVYFTEEGCDPFTTTAYYNSTPTLEGATAITGTDVTSGNGTRYGRWYSFTPDVGLPEGEWYVCVVITSTATDDPTKSASTTSDFIKMTFAPAELGMEGSGMPDDPFLLKTGDDFVTLQQQVASGNTLFGMNFKMVNDITLPEDWVSMGPDGANGLFFGGIIDGDGHTLSFAKHSQPLIHHAKGAEIKNLKIYGEEIQGPALISSSWINQTMGAWIAKIDNVTLVSGTSTLTSGLVAGSASTYNPIYLSNCYAEEGVIIGYDKSKSGIGTFAGGLIGGMTNCNSAATVYGVNNVGGLLGSQSNSMAAGNFVNCWFTGTIVATGNNVGGLMGAGYNSNSAPNALCVRIQNCYVIADITGKNNVGGLLGSNAGIEQAWENGIGYVRDNVFYGTLTGEKNVGGLVGYYSSLNKYNIIENNYYYDTNGCNTPIGGVEHIDTSTHEFGMGDDGIFYYDTSRDSLEDIKEFVDAEDKGTADWAYTSVSKTNHNRTDDPMGADKEKLGKPCTADEMADGTVLKLLNESETSQKNWIQGEKCPIIDNAPIVTALTISGEYKDEYYIGEELDLTGAVFTATWSDGTTTTVALEDVTIEGFDSSERASLILTASYQGVSCEFIVKVVKKPVEEDVNSIKVSFILLGDEKHDSDSDGNVHTLTAGNLTTWIEETTYTVDLNATVWDVIQKALEENNMTCKYTNSLNTVYIQSVTNGDLTLGEFDNGGNSGWMFTLNGVHPELGVAQQYLEDGDTIIFHYTDDYTQEVDKVDNIDVNVSISVAGDVVMAQESISVADLDGNGKFNVDEVLYAAHQAGYNGGAAEGYGSASGDYGLAITKLWGDTSGCYGYWLNHASCWNLDDEVHSGDYLVAFVYSDASWSDAYAKFDSFVYAADTELTVTLEKTGYDEDYNAVFSPLTGADITAYADGSVVDPGKYTVKDNGDGTYTITFMEDGDYTLVATEDSPIVPAVCKVSVVIGRAEADVDEIYKTTGDYLESLGTPGVGSIGGEWMVIGLKRSGRAVQDDYYDAVIQYVRENINENEQLHRAKSTDNARIILALTAMGYDVTNVDGHNLLAGLTDLTYLNKQGINGPIWALIAFDSYDYEILEGNVSRELLIQTILDAQLGDGGWVLGSSAASSDADMTAMAIQALAPYYDTDSDVKAAVDKALTFLSDTQLADGSFGSVDGSCSESCAQVIVALTALGIDPENDPRFVKNGISVVDALCGFYVTGGGFRHIADGNLDGMATEQGYYALAAYFRFLSGQNRLYDMTDVEISTTSVNPFDDVEEGRYYYDAVLWGVNHDIVRGMTEDLFVPGGDCTRAQFVTFLWRAVGCPEPESTATGFTDLRSGAYYTKAIAWATEQGIVRGVTATEFAPEGICTRAQAVTFLWRMAGKPQAEGETAFTDLRANAYYYNAVLWATQQGIVKGMTTTTFVPDYHCTRGQSITLIYRYMTK